MEKYTSTNIDLDNSNLQLTIGFSIGDGTGETAKVDEPLLTSDEAAEARAISIFLDTAYLRKKVSFTIYHIDGITLGDIISIRGVLYVIDGLKRSVKQGKLKIVVSAERYE